MRVRHWPGVYRLGRRQDRDKWREAHRKWDKTRREGPETSKAQPQRKLGLCGQEAQKMRPLVSLPKHSPASVVWKPDPGRAVCLLWVPLCRAALKFRLWRAGGRFKRTDRGWRCALVSRRISRLRAVFDCWLGLREKGWREEQHQAGGGPSLRPPRGGRLCALAPGPAPGLPSVWPVCSARLL